MDNASRDGSAEFVRGLETSFNLRIIENKINLGFAKANNRALSGCSAQYIALLNNDTKVEKDWLSKLAMKMLSSSDIAIVSSRQVPDESSRPIDPLTNETSWCSGGHCLIRRQALDAAGYLDEKFFMYAEDVDLSWRMWLAGYKCVYVPDAVCQHHYAGKELYTVRRLYYHARNSILLRYAYGRPRDIAKEIFRWSKEGLALGIKHLNFKKSYAVLAAVITHLFFIAHFLKKGSALKKMPRFGQIRQKWMTL